MKFGQFVTEKLAASRPTNRATIRDLYSRNNLDGVKEVRFLLYSYFNSVLEIPFVFLFHFLVLGSLWEFVFLKKRLPRQQVKIFFKTLVRFWFKRCVCLQACASVCECQ